MCGAPTGTRRFTRLYFCKIANFRVFSGSERFLLDNLRNGGAGCISAMANIHPGAIVNLNETRNSPEADAKQQALNNMRALYEKVAMIPALKRTVAEYGKAPGFKTVRPPLMELSDEDWGGLKSNLSDLSLKTPNLDKILA